MNLLFHTVFPRLNKIFLVAILMAPSPAVAHQEATSTSAPHYVDVDGIKLWYEECGSVHSSGPSIVLLHDGLVHSVTWNGVWSPLCSKYHVVRYDRRGYGLSQPSTTRFVPEDDLLKIMRHVHMERVFLVGNSSGGGLALDFTVAHPDMVAGLFLIGPVVHGMASTQYFVDRGNRNNAPLAQRDTKTAAQNWSQDRFLIAGAAPDQRKLLYQYLAENPQNLTVNGGMEIRPSPPTVGRLSQIRVPVMVLVGEADIADVFAYSGAIQAAVPLASFEVVKDSGHLIQLQQPEKLVSRFNSFYALATRKEVNLSQAQLAADSGTYLCFNQPSTVTVKDQRLMLEVPGDPYYYLFAATDSRFFMRTEVTEVEFKKDSAGKTTEMVIHNVDGNVFSCPRR